MPERMELLVDRVATPIGELLLACDADGRLRSMDWADNEERMQRMLRLGYGKNGYRLLASRNPHGLAEMMGRYFAGEVGAIDKIEVATPGTPFQRTVWKELRNIPCGTTVSYGLLAERIARPTAIRAVGLANGSNPVSVVVPCHRVIGADGSLTGYGGGLHRKRWLLDHERAGSAHS